MNKRFLPFLCILVLLPVKIASSFAADASSGFHRTLQQEGESFFALDTAPNFLQLNITLQQRTTDFSTKLFPILEEDVFTKFNETTALSNHTITWGEVATFLTSIGGVEKLQSVLTTEESDHIANEVFNHLLFKEDGSYQPYEVVVDHPAKLPLVFFQCYANWRTVRYYCYEQLLLQEAACRKEGSTYFRELSGELTDYLKKKNLWPIVNLQDPLHSTDNLDVILAQSIGIGTYWFSQVGNKGVERRSEAVPYRLATSGEVALLELSPDDHLEIATLEQEGYGLLAINIKEMQKTPGFEEQKKQQQEASVDHYVRLGISNQQEISSADKSNKTTQSLMAPVFKGMGVIAILGAIALPLGRFFTETGEVVGVIEEQVVAEGRILGEALEIGEEAAPIVEEAEAQEIRNSIDVMEVLTPETMLINDRTFGEISVRGDEFLQQYGFTEDQISILRWASRGLRDNSLVVMYEEYLRVLDAVFNYDLIHARPFTQTRYRSLYININEYNQLNLAYNRLREWLENQWLIQQRNQRIYQRLTPSIWWGGISAVVGTALYSLGYELGKGINTDY